MCFEFYLPGLQSSLPASKVKKGEKIIGTHVSLLKVETFYKKSTQNRILTHFFNKKSAYKKTLRGRKNKKLRGLSSKI